MQLTDRQTRAVRAEGENILVSAAAGSGKTSVLSLRIARLVSEGEDVKRMLICTFTNLAAAEMRERISRRLFESAEQTGSVRMRAQAESVSSADICTIHGFCLKLVKEFGLSLGLPPLRIAGEQLQKTIFSQAMEDAFFDLAQERDGAFLRLAGRYVTKSEDEFKSMLSQIYNFAMTMEEGLSWIAGLKEGDAFSRLKEMYADMKRRGLARMVAYYETCARISEENGWQKQLESDIAELEDARRIACAYGEDQVFFQAIASHKKRRRQSGLAPERMNELHNDCKKKARAELKIASETETDAFSAMLSEERYLLAQAADIYTVLSAFDERYTEAKLEKGVATFDDVLRYALMALRDDELCVSVRSRYDYVFVDEYQDTNPLQDAIIERVSRRRFMVGDIKQSIYRFRLADPLIFRKKQDEYDGRTEGVELIRMNDNFRSSLAVTGAVNAVMKRLMSRSFGEIDYEGGEELTAGLKTEGSAELLLTVAPEGDLHAADARRVAGRIVQLHAQGTEYSDIAVLLTSANVQGQIYREIFESMGIPCDGGSQAAQLGGEEELFCDLLRVINGVASDISLISVLRSPVGGLDEKELAEVRLKDPEGSFSAAIQLCREGSAGEKCASFLALMSRYRLLAGSMELPSFLITLKNETMLCELARVRPGGEKRAQAFESFFDSCLSEAGSRESLYDLVSYLDELKSQGEPYSPEKRDKRLKEGCVHIMTVHASKGLEFPAVFFSCLHKDMNRRSLSASKVLFNSRLGMVTDIYDEKKRTVTPSLLKETLKDELLTESKSELLRLCYVAMTRAKDRLILSGAVKDAEAFTTECALSPKELVIRRDDPLHWLLWAGGIEVSLENDSVSENAERTKGSAEAYLKEAAMLIPKGFMFCPGKRAPLKVGVSSLLPEYLPADAPVRKPDTAPGGAGLGTLIHLFLEHASFTAFEGVENQVKRMRAALLITAEEERSILYFRERLEAFMAGETAARIARAQRIMRETPFNISLPAREIGMEGEEEVLVQGMIDLLLFEPEGITIVDYKSNHASEESLPALVAHYEKQMSLYSRAVELITGSPAKECLLCFLRAGRTVSLK